MTSVSTDRRQGVNSGSAIKVPCRLATTANIALSGLVSIDGTVPTQDDRILVKNQTDTTENGIYLADSGDWARAVDFDGQFDVKTGTIVKVNEGATQFGFWYVTSDDDPDFGTDSIVFAQASTVLGTVASGFFFAPDAVVNKVNDRLFIGGATANAGTNVAVQADWLTTYQLAKGRANGFIQSAQGAILNSDVADASNAFVAGAQTLHFPSGNNAIAVLGVGVSNNTVGTGNAYAGYFEAYRNAGVSGGAYGIEVDTINYKSVVATDPYQQLAAQTIGVQVGAGGAFSAVGQFASSAAINIQKNGCTFGKGIVFGKDAITGADGTTGTGPAIALGIGHAIQWYGAATTITSSIYGTGTTAAAGLNQIFANNQVHWDLPNGKPVFQVFTTVNDVNFVSCRSSVTGAAAQVTAQGDDTNVDLELVAKAAGTIRLTGTSTVAANGSVATVLGSVGPAGSNTTVQQWLRIKTDGGTVRYIPCF